MHKLRIFLTLLIYIGKYHYLLIFHTLPATMTPTACPAYPTSSSQNTCSYEEAEAIKLFTPGISSADINLRTPGIA